MIVFFRRSGWLSAMPEETVRVLVRCRPFNKREIDLGCENVITMDQEVRLVQRTHTHTRSPCHFHTPSDCDKKTAQQIHLGWHGRMLLRCTASMA